jgi:hypothetical protein
MRKETPEWLKKYYNRLWERYKNESFTFQFAMKELGLSKKMITKTLLELEKRGLISKERNPIDFRAKTYKLIPNEDINFAVGLYSLMERGKIQKMTLLDKLIFIGDRLLYAITGSHAAYYYHNYINPPKTMEIKINFNDAGKWIAFLTDEKTRVFLDDVIETKKIDNYVKLLDSRRAIDDIRTKTKEGYYIEKPEFLIIELLERQTQTSIIEAVAMILSNKKSLSWGSLLNLAKTWGVSRRLGFLLDAINLEARRNIINPETIEILKKDAVGKVDDVFPRDEILLAKLKDIRNKAAHQVLLTEKEKEEVDMLTKQFLSYEELSRKWGMNIILPRLVIHKVLEDLGVKFGQIRSHQTRSKQSQ